MSDLGKAYVQIIPSAKGISGSISKELGGEVTSAGKTAGMNLGSAIKGAIAAAGIGAAVKSALEAGGNLQQSFGGLETLYGEAAEGAKKYAVEAAQAGISANSYAEQAVSFGASLKQAFGGDTTKAMESANTAIIDMADNSAKMGTDITSIQTAYQGFAKQNYTMLDNLKLGYGGTKTEMERLLADAQKLSGVEYNIDNLGDVYSAIHVIQEDLGLTGVAADEASSTFTGSLGAMKAAGENLLANITLGEDIGPALNTLGETVKTFLFNNLFPMIGNILSSVPELVSGLGNMLIEGLNIVSNNSEQIISQGLEIVTSLVEAIVQAAPYLVDAAFSLIKSLGEALLNTDWISIGNNLINSLRDSISQAAGNILGTDDSTISGILASISAGLPSLLESGVSIINEIVNGLLSSLPSLITTAGELISQFVGFLLDSAPSFLESGMTMLLNLVNGIISNLPEIVAAVAQVVSSFLATLGQHLPEYIQQGIMMIGKLAAGLIQAIPKLIAAIPQIIKAIVTTFAQFDWPSIGMDILIGVKNGILGAVSEVVNAAIDAAGAIWDAVKGFFDIGSPSKLMEWSGQMIDEGLALGITKNTGLVDDAIDTLGESATAQLQIGNNYGAIGGAETSESKLDRLLTLLDEYLPQMAESQGVNISLEGDAQGLFNVVRDQNKIYKRMNGQSAFT